MEDGRKSQLATAKARALMVPGPAPLYLATGWLQMKIDVQAIIYLKYLQPITMVFRALYGNHFQNTNV